MLISMTAATTCSCILSSHIVFSMHQVNSARNRCLISPTSDTVVEKGDQLIMMRPTCIASNGYRALPKPIKVDPGTSQCTAHQLLSCHQSPETVHGTGLPGIAIAPCVCLCVCLSAIDAAAAATAKQHLP